MFAWVLFPLIMNCVMVVFPVSEGPVEGQPGITSCYRYDGEVIIWSVFMQVRDQDPCGCPDDETG
jgi:hypothetical protein